MSERRNANLAEYAPRTARRAPRDTLPSPVPPHRVPPTPFCALPPAYSRVLSGLPCAPRCESATLCQAAFPSNCDETAARSSSFHVSFRQAQNQPDHIREALPTALFGFELSASFARE